MNLQGNQNCEEALTKLTDLLQGEDVSELVDILVQQYPKCRDALQAQFKVWESLGDMTVPQPSSKMDDRFYTALDKQSKLVSDSSEKIITIKQSLLWRVLAAASIFIAGLFVGKQFMSPLPQGSIYVQENEASNKLIYANQNHATATDKLLTLQQFRQSGDPNDRILSSLELALLSDPNVNVRLAAVETLVFFAAHPQVREILIKAIPLQDSPLVQVALADAMLLLQEQRSSQAWQTLFESDILEPDVKIHLQKTLKPIL